MQQNDDLRAASERLTLEQERSREQLHYVELRSRQFLRVGIVMSTALIATVAAVFGFFQQKDRQAEVDRLLQTEIASQSQELLERVEQAEELATSVMAELERERERLADLPAIRQSGTDSDIERSLAALDARISTTENVISDIQSADVVEKLSQIERTLEGDVTRLLSVPLLRARFDSLQTVTANDTRRLETSITALDGRLDFIVLTTVTVIVGFITAFVAPLLASFTQRRSDPKSSTNAALGGDPTATD